VLGRDVWAVTGRGGETCTPRLLFQNRQTTTLGLRPSDDHDGRRDWSEWDMHTHAYAIEADATPRTEWGSVLASEALPRPAGVAVPEDVKINHR
jgi:hypothetical protein